MANKKRKNGKAKIKKQISLLKKGLKKKKEKKIAPFKIPQKKYDALDETLTQLSDTLTSIRKQGKDTFAVSMLLRHTHSQRKLLNMHPSKKILDQVTNNLNKIKQTLMQIEKEHVEDIRKEYYKREQV